MLDRFARRSPAPDLLDNELGVADTIASLRERYGAITALVDEIVEASDLDAPCRVDDDEADPDLRWVLAHLVAETARHAGHADMIRELLDGRTGR